MILWTSKILLPSVMQLCSSLRADLPPPGIRRGSWTAQRSGMETVADILPTLIGLMSSSGGGAGIRATGCE